MEKILVLCLIVAMSLSITGATCMKSVEESICNPPPLVVEVVKGAVSIIKFAVSFYATNPTSQAFLAAVDAQAAANTLLNTGCIGVIQLNKLIAWIGSADAEQAEQMKAMVEAPLGKEVKAPAKASVLNPQPLIDWRDAKAGK